MTLFDKRVLTEKPCKHNCVGFCSECFAEVVRHPLEVKISELEKQLAASTPTPSSIDPGAGEVPEDILEWIRLESIGYDHRRFKNSTLLSAHDFREGAKAMYHKMKAELSDNAYGWIIKCNEITTENTSLQDQIKNLEWLVNSKEQIIDFWKLDVKKLKERIEGLEKERDDYLVKLVEMADWAWREHHRMQSHEIKLLLEKYGHQLDQYRRLTK
jgi:hypothetical protein